MGLHESVVQIIDSVVFFPLLHVIMGILSCEELAKSVWLSHFVDINHAILGPYLFRSLKFLCLILEISRCWPPVRSGRSYILIGIVGIVLSYDSTVIFEDGSSLISNRWAIGCYNPAVLTQNGECAFLMTMGCRSMCGLLRLKRFALFGQLEKVWVIIEILVGGPEFLACVHGEIYVVVLIRHIEAGDASLAGAKHRVHDVVLVWIPAVLHPAEQRQKLCLIKYTVASKIKNIEEITDQIFLVFNTEICAEEDKMFYSAFAVAINVKEPEGLLCGTKVNSELLYNIFKKHLKWIRSISWKTVHVEFLLFRILIRLPQIFTEFCREPID